MSILVGVRLVEVVGIIVKCERRKEDVVAFADGPAPVVPQHVTHREVVVISPFGQEACPFPESLTHKLGTSSSR